MKHMLDTNICIYLIKKKLPSVLQKFEENSLNGISISSITLAELEHGVFMSAYPKRNADALSQFLSLVYTLPFDSDAAYHYGIIRADLQRKGMLIGQMDMLIAAHAQSKDLTVVTNNTREFERVRNLKIENWV